jgi:hypothetical protein
MTTPALLHLMGAYLNQDWPEDYADEWEALDDLVLGAKSDAPALPLEIAWVLATYPTEGEIEEYMRSLGSGYAADPDEGGYRGWLIEVSRRVQAAVRER